MSTAKTCINEAILVLNSMLKSESQTFYKNLLKSSINNLSNALYQCESYEKVKSLKDEVFIVENGTVRKARKEEILKLVHHVEDLF